jgi:hypothetical protein
MQALFKDPVRHDFVALARETAEAVRDVVPRIEKQLDGERGDVVGPKRLDRYVGKYYNEVRTFCVCVREREDGLWTDFQGNEVENYRMRHQNADVFEWLMTRDEMVRRGRNSVRFAEYWKIRFVVGEESDVNRFYWGNEKDLQGEAWNLGKIRIR